MFLLYKNLRRDPTARGHKSRQGRGGEIEGGRGGVEYREENPFGHPPAISCKCSVAIIPKCNCRIESNREGGGGGGGDSLGLERSEGGGAWPSDSTGCR